MNHPDEVALYAAQQIEDIVWTSHAGGRAQFLARVQVVVVDGKFHTFADMLQAGGWASTTELRRRVGLIAERLQAVGVRLAHYTNEGWRIEAIR